jgi:putative ABC transport system ATP-binding protein
MSDLLIETRNLVKDYHLGSHTVHALRGVTVSVASGDFVAVMGPSGSGKSTFMNLLGCLDTPTGGQYLLDGQDVSTLAMHDLALVRNRKIGFVFQGFNLLARASALENVELPLMYAGTRSRDRRERARASLASVGLADREHHQPSQLSGGQQQRVFLARALAQQAELYFMDEPFAGVDAATETAIVEVLRELRAAGKTVVAVHHDLQTVPQYFDHVVLLNMRLVAAGSTPEVFTPENLQKTYGGRLTLLDEAAEAMRGGGGGKPR